jgi:hypothetical protein
LDLEVDADTALRNVRSAELAELKRDRLKSGSSEAMQEKRKPRPCSQKVAVLSVSGSAESKLHPLLQARLLLPLREISVQAMLRTKLLIRQPLPNKAEVAVTNFTARLRWAAFVLRLFARHLHFLNLTGFIRSSQAT